MKYDLKNESELQFISFLYSERKLAIAFALTVIDIFKRMEKDNFYQSSSEFKIILSEQNIINIFKEAETIEITKTNKNFSTEKKHQTPEHLLESISFFFNDDKTLKVSLFKRMIRELFTGLSLDNPSDLAEHIRINIQNIMDRELQKENNVNVEINFLNSISKDNFKLSDLSSKIVNNSIDIKFLDLDYFHQFASILLENVKREVYKIPDVNVALSLKTNDLLESIVDSSISEQLNYINLYIQRTEQALVQFFNKNSKNSMNSYISKIEQFFKLLKKYTPMYQEEWKTLRRKYELEKSKLISNIHLVMENLEGRQDELRTKSKIEKYFDRFRIREDYDSTDTKTRKRDLFNLEFGIKVDKNFRNINNKHYDDIDAETLRNTLIEDSRERIYYSEEEIEEIKYKKEKQDKIELEVIQLENEKHKEKSILLKKIYKILLSHKDEISIDNFQEDSMKVFDRIYVDYDFVSLFKGIFSEDELKSKRVLYKIIEELFSKEYSQTKQGEQ